MSGLAHVASDAGAIFWREWLRYRRDRAYWVGQVAFPLLFVALVGLGLDGVAAEGEATRYSARLAAGLLALTLSSGAVGAGFALIQDRQSGFLRALCVAPLTATGVVLGKIAARAWVSALLLTALVTLFSLFTTVALPRPWAVFASLGAITVLFSALGIALASWFHGVESFRLIAALFTVPIYLLSGMFYSVDRLPAAAQLVARANPLTYGVDLLRYGLLGEAEFSVGWSVALLGGVAALALPVAIGMYRAGVRR